jgi:hypothetical protein
MKISKEKIKAIKSATEAYYNNADVVKYLEYSNELNSIQKTLTKKDEHNETSAYQRGVYVNFKVEQLQFKVKAIKKAISEKLAKKLGVSEMEKAEANEFYKTLQLMYKGSSEKYGQWLMIVDAIHYTVVNK